MNDIGHNALITNRDSQLFQRKVAAGFTLVEMIIVIVISGIIGGILVSVIVGGVKSYDDQTRRAALVDSAEGALRRMQRDIRRAVPNSVRIACGGGCIEILHTRDGGRYRANQPLGDALDFTANTDSFDVLGQLTNIGGPLTGADSTACINGTAWCLVIYNLGVPATPPASGNSGNAYHGASNSFDGVVATISAISATSVSFNNSNLANWNFAFTSPAQRFYIVDTPVTYLCNTTARTLTRYSDYAITAVQPTNPSAAPLNTATAARMADHVTNCKFTYDPGSIERSGLVTIDLTVSDPSTSELLRLLHQVHVDNIP